MTAVSAQPRIPSNVPRPFPILGVGSGHETIHRESTDSLDSSKLTYAKLAKVIMVAFVCMSFFPVCIVPFTTSMFGSWFDFEQNTVAPDSSLHLEAIF